MSKPILHACGCFQRWQRGETTGFFQWGGFLPGEWCYNEPFELMGLLGDSHRPQVKYDTCPGCGQDLTRPPGAGSEETR